MPTVPSKYTRLDPILFKPVDEFFAYASPDGETCYAITTLANGGGDFLCCSNRYQLDHAIHAMHTAAYMMARASGRGIDADIADRHLLHPDIEQSAFTYEPDSERLRITLAFNRGPLAQAMYLTKDEYIEARGICDKLVGLTGGGLK